MNHLKPARAPLVTAFLVLMLLSLACNLPLLSQEATPGGDPMAAVNTAAAQTLEALHTEVAMQELTSTQPVPVIGNATSTATPKGQSASATPKPSNTATASASNTPAPTPCDTAGFISDVSVPDGTVFPAGTQFTKTWRLRNNGTCTWSANYALVFDSGDAMGGPASQPLGQSVAPGATIDISVQLTAPSSNGDYKGYWRLRNAAGVLFGVGANNQTFYVMIKVASVTPAAGGYEFIDHLCGAEWTGNDKAITCPGTSGDKNGFMYKVNNPILETGYKDNEPALLMNPPYANDSVIKGKFTLYQVASGDHFTSIVSCAFQATSCNVRFELLAQAEDGTVTSLGTWNEVYDNTFHKVDVDLSSLAGKSVRFILQVKANGSGDGATALWLRPRVVHK